MAKLTSYDQFDPKLGIFEAFAAAAQKNPDAPALYGEQLCLSYAELLQQAESVASLLQDAGVGPGDFVGLYARRSLTAIIGMLGCLRASAAFVPLDPGFAPEQLGFIASDVPLRATLCSENQCDPAMQLLGSAHPLIVLETAIAAGGKAKGQARSGGTDPACILYTSGTTGQPKGVVLPHRAITSMALGRGDLGMHPKDVSLHAATIACDGALYEIMTPLLSGAAVAVVEANTPALDAIADTMIRRKVSVAPWYAGLHHLMIEHRIDAFETVRLSIAGGDVMSAPLAEKLLRAKPDLMLINAYGPTETCVDSLWHKVTLDDLTGGAIPIGHPLPHEQAFVLDDTFQLLGPGEVGQLAIGGLGVANGYYQQPERTAQSFIPDPRPDHDGTVYLTGDLAQQRADGVFEFRGRLDRQVKIAGRRVEIEDVEHVLRSLPEITDAAVELVTDPKVAAHLAAYVVPVQPVPDEAQFIADIKDRATQHLSSQVFPRQIILCKAFPMTQAGKIDRKALRSGTDAPLAPPAHPAGNDIRAVLSQVWQQILGCPPPSANDTFFDLGGTSLQLIDAHALVEKKLELRFDIVLFFDVPRLGDLTERLAALAGTRIKGTMAVAKVPATDAGADIAIVGMAARLPGVGSLDEFWQVMRDGRSVIDHFDPDEIEDAYDGKTRASGNYVPARSVLPDVDQFDAKFFDMRPREAALTDPQGRVFLEICQEALDDAGIDPDRASEMIGLFAGGPMSTYLLENLMVDRAEIQKFTSGFQTDYTYLVGNDSDSIATRVAYKLGLKGPAIALNTACSTSLVAIVQACDALRAGRLRAVLAGGVSITFPQKRGYLYQEGGMVSPDGLCRPFDAQAGGTVFGHGAGVVVLKRLSDAQMDGDHIHAVIRGVGLNNDGAAKMSYTAPSVSGQVDVIRMAHKDAGIKPGQIGYVECHGTATPLGDPIEISGLSQVFSASTGTTALGSVKGNLGHLDAAAGVVSVIKAALVLGRQVIPPVAHFNALNPRIDLADTPFWIPQIATAWKGDTPRVAGVSSFGVGGTNAHVVLAEAPGTAPPANDLPGPVHLPLSAKTPEAVQQMAQDLANRLEATPDMHLPDVALTLQDGRRVFDWRVSIAASTREDAVKQLATIKAPRAAVSGEQPEIVFLFPGQGAQYPGMGAGLYASEPDYARWIDAGAELLQPILGQDIRRLILGQDISQAEAASALSETWITQPALYLTEYATARLWQARGIQPQACIGHSVGEFAAATLTGIMGFEDALTFVAKRGQLMQAQPGGAMLSVRATLESLTPHLTADIDIAARNAPQLQVVSGPFEAISALEQTLQQAEIACQRLHTSHAFHSKMMDPVADALEEAANQISLFAPTLPIYSAVTGALLRQDEACAPSYWASQARRCVNFQAAVSAASQTESPVFVEVGPGRTLSAFTVQTLDRSRHRGVFHSLPDHARSVPDEASMATASSNLWSVGIDVDWARLGPRGSVKVSLPSYPFQRQRCWIDPVQTEIQPTPDQTVNSFEERPTMPNPAAVPPPANVDRSARLILELATMLSDMSGEDVGVADAEMSFLDLGLDSLFMGQLSMAIARQYEVEISFRRLLSDLSTLQTLAEHLNASMPADVACAEPLEPAAAPPAVPAPGAPVPVAARAAPGLEGIIQSQLQTMQSVFAQQLHMLGGENGAQTIPQAPAITPVNATPIPASVETPETTKVSQTPDTPEPKGFKVGRGPSVTGGTLTGAQIAFAGDLAARYSAKFPKSKAYTARHRKILADPRTAAGFRAEWKELTFPVVAETSKGAYIHDLDGNKFVDLVNGFGQTAFGHSPDFVIDAVQRQMEKGFPIGPQTDLAGPVAQKFADFVGHERVTFCNTGSEAVMAAMRVARTVTGRDLVVVFDKDYHGQFDEVLIKGRTRGTDRSALPIAPGIPRSGLNNMIVLPYGAPEALDWLQANIQSVAAVIVEPVQSRHPAHRPKDFVRDLRQITKDNGAALVIDEVVTGFRTDKRGMQGIWGIQGDMATYGKVVGGGMPIGVLAGDAHYMDALDGGDWQFGDNSSPEAVPTFFAGTFVRHPLVLAAVDASLDHMAADGNLLWVDAARRTADLAARLSQIMTSRGLPDLIETYSSWFVINVTEADPRATLLYPLMRMEGVHVMDAFCGFLTTEHTDADCQTVAQAFETALDALLSVGILSELRDNAQPGHPTKNAAVTQTSFPLTESQQEIWMSHQMGGMAAAAFNESGSLWLNGTLDVAALQFAWDALLERHDALRLRFARDGAGFQVTPPQPNPFQVVDYAGETDPGAALERLIAKDALIPFDVTQNPPIRAHIVRMGSTQTVLVMTVHHIVADGWSFGVLLDDLAALYAARVQNRAPDLPDAPSFAAYAQQAFGSGADAKTLNFWKDIYSTIPTPVNLPTDRPRPERKTHSGGTVFYDIGGDVVKAAKKLGAASGCTLFATSFAAMQILVHRLSGATDIVLGVPTAAQQQMPNPDLVGHCVNFLPVRAPITDGTNIKAHLVTVRDRMMDAFDHQGTTFGTIVQALEVPRQINRLPLTEIEFNLEKDGTVNGMPGLEAEFRPNAKRAVNFDLFFNLTETVNGLRIDAHYNADLFDAGTVRNWARAYEAVLTSMIAQPDQPVTSVPLELGADQQTLVAAANATARPYDTSATLPDIIANGVRNHPDAIAIEDATGRISYAELATRSDALAALIQRAVPGQGQRVAVCLPRGALMLASLLAVLKAGHAYVPLDPLQPDARLRQITDAANVATVLCDTEETAGFASGSGCALILASAAREGDVPEPVTVSSGAAAYVIFTSGSTGTPKGVEVPHRAVVNFLTSMAETPGLSAKDSLLAVTTVMFDIAVLELFLPLTVGARVVIAPTEDVIDGFRLVARLQAGDITVMQATPTLWDMVLTAGFTPPQNFRMLCGGEPLPADLSARLTTQGAELWNMYGPTETTIWSAAKKVFPGDKIDIGFPIANTGMHVLDASGQIAPVGGIGELNISGDGLAIGYFNSPELTEKAFREVSLDGTSTRVFATGDLARRSDTGEIEVLGRIDTQVKLRGFRIELGEIETRLRGLGGVKNAAVDLHERSSGDKHLVGYIVPEDGMKPSTDQLFNALADQLPDYMVPRAWVVLSALPQTANGKLDRKALPHPQTSASVAPLHKSGEPETETERQIAKIWCDVLGYEQISLTDTLFSLGIDSLAVFHIAAQMLKAGLNLEAKHMFAHPSIRDLAAFHDGRTGAATPSTKPSLKDFRRGARRDDLRGRMS